MSSKQQKSCAYQQNRPWTNKEMFSLQNSNNTPVLSNPSANVNEVVKYVRGALTGVSKGANDPGIKNRSVDGFFKNEKLHSWKKTLDRRTQQKSCGFFARPDNKYKECGGVELENRRLVINSLKRIGNYFHAQVSLLLLFLLLYSDFIRRYSVLQWTEDDQLLFQVQAIFILRKLIF